MFTRNLSQLKSMHKSNLEFTNTPVNDRGKIWPRPGTEHLLRRRGYGRELSAGITIFGRGREWG